MKKRVQHLLYALSVLCVLFCLCRLSVSATGASSAGTGTKDNPWNISAEAGTDNVSAWYEGSEQNGYSLFISGEGRMADSFRTIDPPWKSIKQNIVTVEIGEGVTNVGAYAFNYCRRLNSVSLPASVTEIGTYAFHFTGVKHLVVPAKVQTIGRMVANPTTYYEVLGSPENVDDHAFNTSLVSVPDQATAEALNAKTNVSAIIVLDGGVYGKADDDLANLSYGLIAPTKEGFDFGGWYQNAECSGKPLTADHNGRTTTNINHIYYAKWAEKVNVEYVEVTEDSVPAEAENVNDIIGELPDNYVWDVSNPDEELKLVPGGTVTLTAVSTVDGSKIIYTISKNPALIQETDSEYEINPDDPDQIPAKYYEIGKSEAIVIKSTGALDRLQEVIVDGKAVDKSNYFLVSGSTILTFAQTYLDTLSVGDHTVALNYEVGSVEVLIKVVDSAPTPTQAPGGNPTPAPSGPSGGNPTPAPSEPSEGNPTPAPSGPSGGNPTPAPSGPSEGNPTPAPSGPSEGNPTPAPSGPSGGNPTAPSGPSGGNPASASSGAFAGKPVPTTTGKNLSASKDNTTPVSSGQNAASPSPVPSLAASGETTSPSGEGNSAFGVPEATEKPSQPGATPAPEAEESGESTAENQGINWLLPIGISAAILLGIFIFVFVRRKQDDSEEGRKER